MRATGRKRDVAFPLAIALNAYGDCLRLLSGNGSSVIDLSSVARAIRDSDDSAQCAAGSPFGAPQSQVPASTYATALVELCACVWVDLEGLVELCEQTGAGVPGASSILLLKAATLRLELLVLLDSCDSAYWRSLLNAAQRQNLRSMLIDVFEAIAFTPDALRRCAIEQAQDRLFDEVLACISKRSNGGQQTESCPRAQGTPR
jgi:hypothetical protein